MTTPPPTPPTDEQKALVLYTFQRMAAVNRWKNRGMWIAYGAAGIAFMMTLAVVFRSSPDIGFVVYFFAIAVAYVVMIVTTSLVLPRFSRPTLQCPYCRGAVPLIQDPKPFKPFEPVKVCPNCRRELP